MGRQSHTGMTEPIDLMITYRDGTKSFMQAGEIRRDSRKIEIDSWGMGDKDERKPCERNTRPNFLRLCSVWWQITLIKNRRRMTLVIYLPRKNLRMYQAHRVRILYVSGPHHNSFPHTARVAEAIGSLSSSYPAMMTARERSISSGTKSESQIQQDSP